VISVVDGADVGPEPLEGVLLDLGIEDEGDRPAERNVGLAASVEEDEPLHLGAA